MSRHGTAKPLAREMPWAVLWIALGLTALSAWLTDDLSDGAVYYKGHFITLQDDALVFFLLVTVCIAVWWGTVLMWLLLRKVWSEDHRLPHKPSYDEPDKRRPF